MARATYIQRWSISSEKLQKEFCKDWWELSESNRSKHGLIDGRLYHVEPDGFVSMTVWPDEGSFDGRKGAELRVFEEKWGKYRASEPEALTSVIEIRQ